VRVAGILAYMFYRSWRLGCVAVTFIPICSVINRRYGQWLAKNAQAVQGALAASNAHATERLGSVRTVRAFNQQAREAAKYDDKVAVYYDLNVRQTFSQAVYVEKVLLLLLLLLLLLGCATAAPPRLHSCRCAAATRTLLLRCY